jgi:ABC-2 type transport system permease protein
MNRRLIRQTLTIARRDFTATVFTPLFLLFLLSPLIMVLFGVLGGLGGANLARAGENKAVLIAIVPAAEGQALSAADAKLRRIFRRGDAPPPLMIEAPRGDVGAQAQAAFDRADKEVATVLTGPLEAPHILFTPAGTRTADYLTQLAETALSDMKAPVASSPVRIPVTRKAPSVAGRNQSAFLAVLGIFFLTLFLSGQAVGTMAEERSNKVIEILAAAVPLESVFLGKLLGMFGVAVLFVAFWGTLASQAGHFVPPTGPGRLFTDLAPAVGTPAFALLFAGYFAMAYMLLGAVFLSVGAQAQTMREIQMLSLPITITQMLMFGLASAAAADPGSTTATIAEIFPLSSPFAMAARAANRPEIWPHLAALAWQALWVSLTIWLGASAFRRGVLKTGSGRKGLLALLGIGAATSAIDNNVN